MEKGRNVSAAVSVPLKDDKPQGFNVGKLAKRGIHACFFNCGQYFPSRRMARSHPDCVGREKCKQDLLDLHRNFGDPDPGDFVEFLQSLPESTWMDRVTKWKS